MENPYSQLIHRLDDFIKQYYRSKWILGLLYFFSVAILLIILFSSLEYFGYFDRGIRFILLLVFILILIFIGIRYFILPFLSYTNWGSRINYKTASKIIGEHFPSVRDKLLNALELKELSNLYDHQLIEASIDQKIKSFSSIPFYKAIDEQRNWQFLKILAWIITCFILIWVLFPYVLNQGTNRILSFSKAFIPPPPFEFQLLNKSLNSLKNADFELKVTLHGKTLPSELMLENGGQLIPCNPIKPNLYSFTFTNLQKDISFRFYGGGYYSDFYTLKVNPVPMVLNFSTRIEYPSYLNKTNALLENTGDLTIPEGSTILWTFQTESCDSIRFYTSTRKNTLFPSGGTATFQKKASSNFDYGFMPMNHFIKNPDSFHFQVQVIKDNYPELSFQTKDSSLLQKALFFSGDLRDDYGISKLVFHYNLFDPSIPPKSPSFKNLLVPVSPNPIQSFSMVFHLDQIPNISGKVLEYYFEAWDNDGVNGPKSSKTSISSLTLNSRKQDFEQKKEFENSAQSGLNQASKIAERLVSETRKMMEKIQNSSQITYEQRQGIQELLRQKLELDSTLSHVKAENENSQKLNDQSSNGANPIKEKEAQMKTLLDQLLNPETQNLLNRLADLLTKNRNQESKPVLREFNSQAKDLSKEIKRTEALYKELIRDREIQNQIDLVHELAKKEKSISEESKGKLEKDIQSLENQQINSFDDIKKNLETLEKENNKDAVNPDFKNPADEENKISALQKKIQEALSNHQKTQASSLQKSASSSMDELGFALSRMKQNMDAEELSVDLHSIRLILENLLRVSFKQEELIKRLRSLSPTDPSLVDYTQEEYILKDAIAHVQDSLFSLAKKAPAIEATIMKEMNLVHSNMEQTTDYLADHRLYEAQAKEQYVMTSINNLAVVLSNVEKQMAKALSNLKSGGAESGNFPSLNSLISRQKKLNEQMGQTGPGSKPNTEEGNESLVRLASEQEMIRKALENLKNKAESRGKLAGDLGSIQKEMEEIETDLINKRIKPGITIRQKEILTRMLEAEKASKEQGMENKLQAEAGKNHGNGIIKPLAEFIPQKTPSLEFLKTLPPNLNTYYKLKINTYFNLLNDIQPRNEKLGAH